MEAEVGYAAVAERFKVRVVACFFEHNFAAKHGNVEFLLFSSRFFPLAANDGEGHLGVFSTSDKFDSVDDIHAYDGLAIDGDDSVFGAQLFTISCRAAFNDLNDGEPIQIIAQLCSNPKKAL